MTEMVEHLFWIGMGAWLMCLILWPFAVYQDWKQRDEKNRH